MAGLADHVNDPLTVGLSITLGLPVSPALSLTKYEIRRNNPRHSDVMSQVPKPKGLEKTFQNRLELEK